MKNLPLILRRKRSRTLMPTRNWRSREWIGKTWNDKPLRRIDDAVEKMVRTKTSNGRANAGRRPMPRVDADDSSNNSNNNAKDEDNEWETARDVALIFLRGEFQARILVMSLFHQNSKVRVTLVKSFNFRVMLPMRHPKRKMTRAYRHTQQQYIAQLKLAAVLNRYAPYAYSPTLIITKRKHITHL